MPPLENQRHELFAQGLAKGLSADEAYVEAGYAPNDGNCIRLKGNERVRNRVEELMNRTATRTEVTAASLIAEAEEIRAAALAAKQFGAAIQAVKEKGVLSGHRIEKSERKNVSDVSQLTDAEIWAELAAIRESEARLAGTDAGQKHRQGKSH